MEDRLFAAGMTGRKAGEVCTVCSSRRENTDTVLPGVGAWDSLHRACSRTTRVTLAAPKMERRGPGPQAALGCRREAGRPRAGVRKPYPDSVVSGGLLKPFASVSSSVKQRD